MTVEILEREASERPCACGKSPEGSVQKVVPESIERNVELMYDRVMSRCGMECQKCFCQHKFLFVEYRLP